MVNVYDSLTYIRGGIYSNAKFCYLNILHPSIEGTIESIDLDAEAHQLQHIHTSRFFSQHKHERSHTIRTLKSQILTFLGLWRLTNAFSAANPQVVLCQHEACKISIWSMLFFLWDYHSNANTVQTIMTYQIFLALLNLYLCFYGINNNKYKLCQTYFETRCIKE